MAKVKNNLAQQAHLSIRGLIDSPTGKGSAYVFNRSKIKQALNAEFLMLIRRYRKYFSAKPILYPDGRILFWCKIPSSDYKHNKIIYDVLVEISNDKTKRLALRDARFISNNMSFVFTYAYVFYHSGLMINRFSDILPPLSISKFPSIRNPVLSRGYERSLYFACRYLLDGLCLTDKYIRRNGIKAIAGIDYRIKSEIARVPTLIAIYQHTKEQRVKNHRKPIDQGRKAEREKIKRDYIEKRKRDKRETYIKNSRSTLSRRKFRRIIGAENL